MKLFVLSLAIVLGGCATARESYPSRTATEQLLISQAADDAAYQLKLDIPKTRKCFLDTTNFDGVDAKYAVSAIRQNLLEQGIALMETRDLADTIIEIRAGALSIDSKGREILIPGIPFERLLPVAPVNSVNKWAQKTDEGIAKVSAFAYDKASGKLLTVAHTVTGKSISKSVRGKTIVIKQS